MNFFTPFWKSGAIDDDVYDAFAEYQKHLTPLLPQMPPEVQTLATEINLHDGLLWKIVKNIQHGSVALTFRCGDLQVGYYDLEIHYLDVLSLPSLAANLKGLILNHIRKDSRSIRIRSEALYDEVDIEGDAFVHRILFTYRRVYHEFEIHFKQVRLNITPREDRTET